MLTWTFIALVVSLLMAYIGVTLAIRWFDRRRSCSDASAQLIGCSDASIQELQLRAVEYAKSGDFGPQALATNLELAKLAPTNEGALTRLSRCYIEGGQLDEATATLDAALQLNPQNTIARSLQMEVTKRRVASMPVVKTQRVAPRRAAAERGRRCAPAQRRRGGQVAAGIGRAEFAALGQLGACRRRRVARLAPRAAADGAQRAAVCGQGGRDPQSRRAERGAAVPPQHDALAGGPDTCASFHQGVRWEPQLTVGLFSSTPWGRDAAVRRDRLQAGAGRLRRRSGARAGAVCAVPATRLRRLARVPLAVDVENAGFIQHGDTPPSTDLLPNDALAWLINCQHPAEVGWIFFGRWLFLDRSQDAEILADGRGLSPGSTAASRISCRSGRALRS